MQLLLDSSGNALVVALAADGGLVREQVALPGSPLSRNLSGLVKAVLGDTPASGLTHIGVGIGPGSFIGTRVAVSFANGLGSAAGLPVHGLPSLAALALAAGRECAVLRDARRGEAYLHLSYEPPETVHVVPLEDLAAHLSDCSIEVVVAETPAAIDRRGEQWRAAVAAAVPAGLESQWAEHIPAGGLLALLPLCPGRDFAEPLYLRGFL
jgi:tRNA threonylcarbamoyl adenosine modification protein YeaZ